ncbi:C1-like protein [Corchorus olitorius]|uniref:C1-like protein n=1 Tax=Corchorus olitorius TaxID=93759 RepID=A0A1R3HMU7_9ROSI|nr:C1-like protein [Corchorus olitorius]
MHPCCAMLSTEMNISVHPHTLKLLPMPQYSSTSDPGFACGECNKRRSGRVYHCTVCDYHLHAVCAKNMVNGLQANGIKAMDKPSMFGTAAKVATKVMIEFIGGLIEGLGEGVGQVLIQTAARGRCYTRSSARSTT